MSRDHEILHTLTAIWLGHAYSPTLWHVAHSVKPPKGLILHEECLILAFQKYLNTDFVSNELDRLAPTGKSLTQLAAEARAILAQAVEGTPDG